MAARSSKDESSHVENSPELCETRCLRRKTRNNSNSIPPTKVSNTNIKGNVQCKICLQTQLEIVNIPPTAASECVALADEVLVGVYTDQMNMLQHNITNYSIYDKNKHLCAIDSGVLEKSQLFLTGYIKPVCDDVSSIEGGVAVMEVGPILEWWLSWDDTDDSDSDILIGICTDYADYVLFEPHPSYKKYMVQVTKKIQLSKLVFLSMLNSVDDDPTYEDVLNCVVNAVDKKTGKNFTEEDLLTHAQFVVDQVMDYDAGDTHYLPLSETQCIRTLTELSGAVKPVLSKKLQRSGRRTRGMKTNIAKRELSKATTTDLVKDVFENMFGALLDDDKIDGKKNKTNKIVNAKSVFDDLCNLNIKENVSGLNNSYVSNIQVMWNGQKLCAKVFVVVKNNDSEVPLIGRLEYFYKNNDKNMGHIVLFLHGYETVLGEVSDPQEIFAIQKCANIDINNIVKILDVTQKIPSKNWVEYDGTRMTEQPINKVKINSFFYQQQYSEEFGCFKNPTPDNPCDVKDVMYCSNCDFQKLEKMSEIPTKLEYIETTNDIIYFYKFKLRNEEYKVGSFLYLQSGIFSKVSRCNFVDKKSFEQNVPNKSKKVHALKEVDETVYPEYYRKTLEHTMRGSNETTPNPFDIAEILAIYALPGDKKNIKLIVRRMYRAEQIPLENYEKCADLNMLLWSEEHFKIQYDDICGKCYVAFIGNICDPLVWSAGGPDRFYFIKKYDFLTGILVPDYELPSTAKLTGREVFFNYNCKLIKSDKVQNIPSYPKIEPLNSLDIFAGCGGLSRGLEDSGLIVSKWAIECDDKAAAAFRLNNPKTIVFENDCNHLLKLAMTNFKTNSNNQPIPQKGEVDFICGGPPCQGFSGMNRFNSGQYSLFKNSLIVTFLSYVDFYRPKFFVIENVRNFVSFKKNMILKLTIMCIRRMGYQCSFGILQAGNFGVPQTRRRLIILAAAPGEQLPKYPEPTHVFNKKSSHLSVQIGDKKLGTNCKYQDSAPLRTVTVYDAWSDLPEIQNGANTEFINYNSKPITHLQRLFRSPNRQNPDSTLMDHICKEMSPLVQARIELIPIDEEGSDWRDLPNIEVKLSDGTMTNKLVYAHHDNKNGESSTGALRGVCACASGDICDPQDRQSNTIIPWCLPHTSGRHNEWTMLYGRLVWTGYCSTTITNPEPMGKQGRVLHPDQNRVVSVRECARSQGFNDSYMFYGPIINKHRQIGNAVPPPMGTAIGREIIKAIIQNEK